MKIISLNKGSFAFILGLLLWCPHAQANYLRRDSFAFTIQSSISGTVTDAVGPLPGVSITIKGTAVSTSSDSEGKFTIPASKGDVLVFAYIGFKNVEVTVKDLTPITIQLSEDTTTLKELEINAGYYSVKDKERTGSIARITAKDIENQPVTNVLATMQGRMAGVNITQNTGVPGGGFDIQIRGLNSLRSDGNSPLYIVDGMPYYSASYGSSNSGLILPGSGTNPLNSINPSDIESIEVLKDADATSIYGSRGANGVVLITTRKGKAGKTVFSAKSYTGFGTITRKTNMMKTPQYLQMRKQAFTNDDFTDYPSYAYDVNGTWDQNKYTDWQEELIGGTSVINNLQSTISGGNDTTQFLLSNTIYKETTVFPGDFDFKKVAVSFNLNHSSTDKKFNLAFSGNYVADRNDLPATDLTSKALSLSPNAPSLYDKNGGLNWENSTWSNPLAVLYESYEAKNKTLVANGVLRYEVVKDLELKAMLGYSETRFKETRATPSTIYNPAYGLGSEVSMLSSNNVEASSWNFEPQVSYKKQWGQGNLQALVGMTFLERESLQEGLLAQGFSSNSFIDNPAMASTLRALPSNDVTYRYNAVFARINYDWKGRYIVNLTGRRDGSSRFGPGKKFANFGAVGVAWLFSREDWLSKGFPALSFGKLRTSYGSTGNDQIGDYQFLNLYSSSGYSYDGTPGIQPVRLFNADFSWETNKKLEAALELGFLRDRIFFTAAWYRNRSSDQLVGIPLPGTTGFASIQSNMDAVVQNTGWEFELKLSPILQKDIEWQANINLSLPRTKLLSFPGLETSTFASQYIVGQPLNIVQVYQYEGVDPQTGVYQFKDFNNDGSINSNDDRKAVISKNPEYFAGLQNSLRYRNWKVDFLFQYVKQIGTTSAALGTLPGSMSNLPAQDGKIWVQPGDQADVQRYTTGFNDQATDAFYRYISSDGIYTDASYLRLKNLSISYDLPESLTGSLRCRIYALGQNLLTVTAYKDADPETQFSGYLPPLRILSFGTQLTF